MNQQQNDELLRTRNLKVYFPVKAGIIRDRVIGWVRALDGVDLTLKRGQVIGLVGCSRVFLPHTAIPRTARSSFGHQSG